MTNIEKYKLAFMNGLELDESVVYENLELGMTKEWDSIGHMTLIAELEDAFDVYIDSDEMTEFTSYQTGMELLTRLGVDFRS
ncbi:acyl carrier protein [Exiguobacterium algae]|uniref:acyl carrier protein n=1 Tax=Exiguobacterium algae TaxID=2751250 RepID=UPI001BEA6494|nr:acyl carrier protein [Exiguobacterium algae]